MSYLIADKHWKVKDIEDLINASDKIKAFFYACISLEIEAIEKAQNKIKK